MSETLTKMHFHCYYDYLHFDPLLAVVVVLDVDFDVLDDVVVDKEKANHSHPIMYHISKNVVTLNIEHGNEYECVGMPC